MANEKSDNDSVMIVLAYLGPLGLIPYLMAEDNEFIRWHAKQGLTLSAAYLIWTIALPFFFHSGPLYYAGGALFSLIHLAMIAIFIVAILKAVKGERWRIPIVADLSEKW